jgi:hypothetical protein
MIKIMAGKKLAIAFKVIAIVFVLVMIPTGVVQAKTVCISTSTEVSSISEPAPVAPTLAVPAYGALVSTLTPRMQWNASPDVATYSIQVAVDYDFYILVVDESGITTQYYDIDALKLNSAYYWRVNAQNSSGSSSGWSSPWYFRTILSPPTNQPENLIATAISPRQINLSWEDKSNNEIRFKIERKTGQSSYFQITTLGPNVTSYTDTNIAPNSSYYYRVRAYGLAGDSPYSNEASTDILPPPVPVPDLALPGYGYIVSTLTPQMQWNASQDLATYIIQIATDYDFSTLVINETDITTPYYDVPSFTLEWNSSYYWRVRTKDGTGAVSDWSPAWYFMILPEHLLFSHGCGCG